MTDLHHLVARYVSRPCDDVIDLAIAHGLHIEHRGGGGALLIDDHIFTDVFAPTHFVHANVAMCCAFQLMRFARMDRNDATAETIAALILERVGARRAA